VDPCDRARAQRDCGDSNGAVEGDARGVHGGDGCALRRQAQFAHERFGDQAQHAAGVDDEPRAAARDRARDQHVAGFVVLEGDAHHRRVRAALARGSGETCGDEER
jgi:hypothetical protein